MFHFNIFLFVAGIQFKQEDLKFERSLTKTFVLDRKAKTYSGCIPHMGFPYCRTYSYTLPVLAAGHFPIRCVISGADALLLIYRH